MALELLAGPFLVMNQFTGLPLASPIAPYGSSAAIWMDGIGLLVPDADGLYLAQLDGSAYPVAASVSAVAYGLAQRGASNGYAMNRPFYTPAGDWDIDPVTWGYGEKVGSDPLTYSNFLRLPDRYLRPGSNRIESATRGVSLGAWVSEATYTGLGPITSFSWARDARQIVVGFQNGWLRRYDFEAKTFVGETQRIGTTCRGLWYSARHDVYISLSDDTSGLLLRIWASTPQPAAVSAPVASPGLIAGRRVQMSASVTGSEGEPCAGETVAWSLDGPGTLLLAATETDGSGTARTYYDTPADAAGMEVTLTATVAY